MRLVLALMLVFWPAAAMAQPLAAVRAAVDEVIRPGMADFEAQAKGLGAAMEGLCAAPSGEALGEARERFGDAALAYGRIEAIRVGPLMEENRSERILFWPDRKGIALRQVQAILAGEDESATDPQTLKGKSVAVQGLGALEFVLFGNGSEALEGDEGAFRCRYGRAIAQSVAGLAGELAAGWQAPDGIALHLTEPSPDFADYRTPTEAQEELVGLLSHGIEAVRDARINPFIAQGDKGANPRLALFWRSGLTMPMVRANIEGLEALFSKLGMGSDVSAQHAGLPNSISFEFRNAFRAVDLVTSPVDAAVADASQAQALDYLVIVTQSLQAMIGEQLSAALGLSVGFSSLDGD
jgi:uncharacterized protein